MNPIHYKLTAPVALVGMCLLPKGLYKASDLYMRAHNTSAVYIADVTESALSKVGLTTIKPDGDVDSIITAASIKYRIDPLLIKSLVKSESAGNLDAYSPKGAIGLAQIMPDNAKRCGHKSASKLWDERNNIMCGAQILSEELATYKGDLHSALIVYNSGPSGLKERWSGPVSYANNIMMRFAQATYSR